MINKVKRFFSVLTLVALFVLAPMNTWAQVLPKIKPGDPLPANIFIELAKLVNPSVVNISTMQTPRQRQGREQYNDPFFDLFEQFMLPPNGEGGGPQLRRPGQALGTGFVIKEDGLILTNNHVVEGADVIQVSFAGRTDEIYEAEIVGRDTRTDIALIKIATKKPLKVAVLGTSSELEVGEWVAAFGNPFGHDHSVTKGIISAIGRELSDINRFPFIQTDASINPGNSGGPLVNMRGEVIGVNTAIDARAQGIGFAIPIDNIKSIITALEKEGVVKRGFIGVYLGNLTPDAARELNLKSNQGAMITQVMRGGPADKAGLKPYDLITAVDGKKISRVEDLINKVADTEPGKSLEATLIRDGKERKVKVTIESHPEDRRASAGTGKRYSGQKAPFDLGFTIEDYNKTMAEEFGLPMLREPRPVVIQVTRGSVASRAGLAPGDLILDVNRREVSKARDLLKSLKKGQTNTLRVLRGDSVALIYLRP
jgi:serine protease Do